MGRGPAEGTYTAAWRVSRFDARINEVCAALRFSLGCDPNWLLVTLRLSRISNQVCSNSANLLPSESTIGSNSLPSELLTARRFSSSSPPLSTCSSNYNPIIVEEIL